MGNADSNDANEQWKDESDKLGRFNLAVFGKTGVGKSTLINRIYGQSVARTGIGHPVTQGSHVYLTQSGALGLYDTQGIELGMHVDDVLRDIATVIRDTRTADPADHIHVAYYCVRAGDQRLEPAEIMFIQGLHDLGLPVLMVMTQVHVKNGAIRPEHREFAEYIHGLNLPIFLSHPLLTAALPDPTLGYTEFGIRELVAATYQATPEAMKMAMAAAQIVDRQLKLQAARMRIKVAAGMAATVGATPIPFSDAALLVPIQTGMMASISQIYHVPRNASLTAGLAATAAATNLGRSLVGSALKMLPGAGSVAGSAVSASVASSFTYAMGESWAKVCGMMLDERFGPIDHLDNGQIRSAFLDEFKTLFGDALRNLRAKD